MFYKKNINQNILVICCASVTALMAMDVTYKHSKDTYTQKKKYYLTETDKKLLETIKKGTVREVETLLQKGASVEAYDKYGDTALHKAAYRMHYGILELLIRWKANPNTTNNKRETCIDLFLRTFFKWAETHHAPQKPFNLKRPEEVVTMLTDAGARISVDHTNLLEKNIIGSAVYKQLYLLEINRMKEQGKISQADAQFLCIARFGSCNELESLLKKRTVLGLELSDFEGNTALHLAAYFNQPLYVSHDNGYSTVYDESPLEEGAKKLALLLAFGANPNSVNKKNETALLHAIKAAVNRPYTSKDLNNNFIFESIVRLLNYRANPNIVSTSGEWPLTPVVKKIKDSRDYNEYNDKILILLLNNNADPARNAPIFFDCHLELLELLVKTGKISPFTFFSDPNFIHYAVKDLALKKIEFLLNYRVPLQSVDAEEKSLLHHLAHKLGYYNNFESAYKCCRLLLQKGASCNLKDREGATALHQALTAASQLSNGPRVPDFHAFIILLLDSGADVSHADHNGHTPIHLAARWPYYCDALYPRLLPKNIDHANNEGQTPLHLAVKNLAPNLVSLLVRHGANVNCLDNKGNAPLHTLLQQWPRGIHPDREKAESIFSVLIKCGAQTTLPDSNGDLPIMLLANHLALQPLLELGKNSNFLVVDNEGNTLLHKVVGSNNYCGKRTYNQRVPEVYIGPDEIFDMMYGNTGNNDWRFEIDTAVKIAKLLIQKGIAVNSTNKRKETALHLAAQKKPFVKPLIELLLSRGADKKLRDSEGFVPRERAREKELQDIL